MFHKTSLEQLVRATTGCMADISELRWESTPVQMKTERVCASFLGGVKEDLEQSPPPLRFLNLSGRFLWMSNMTFEEMESALFRPSLGLSTLQLRCAVLKCAGFIDGLPTAINDLPFLLLPAWEMETVCPVSLFYYPNTEERERQYPLDSHQAGDMK